MLKRSSASVNEDGLILSGYHKKLKTMKKKFFALYKDTLCNEARLEYFDNEKKFRSKFPPKRIIKLNSCFNINRRLDTKYDYVIALSTKDGAFGIVLETEEEMLKWLEVLISLQRRDDNVLDSSRPNFEHIWQVVVQRKGLAEDKGIIGNYHVCLTSKSVTFIRIGSEKTTSGDRREGNVEFLLTTIRSCGDSECFFYMEVGRQSIVGPGELWMETEDPLIAKNMKQMIFRAMSNKIDLSVEPMRKRSSSANEASKPINILQKKQSSFAEHRTNNSPQSAKCFGRERCDSLPSRSRHANKSSTQNIIMSAIPSHNNMNIGLRQHSYQRHSNSPPVGSIINCSESEESSISFDEPEEIGSFPPYRLNSRSSEGVIPEENSDEFLNNEKKCPFNTGVDDCLLKSHYISMVPTKSVTESDEINKFKSDVVLDTNFLENSVDNLQTLGKIEIDSSQSDFPLRAYSVGSKFEFSINRKPPIDSINETGQNIVRVRAFSVGSHNKTSRSEIKRSILFPQNTPDYKFNSNNNIFSYSDITTCNISSSRKKKSNSAPILIHKCHNSVDAMSDLMEIDFSKNISDVKTHLPCFKQEFSKSVPPSLRDPSISNKGMFHKKENSLQSSSSTDNGYLEMKPLGDLSIAKHLPINLSKTSVNAQLDVKMLSLKSETNIKYSIITKEKEKYGTQSENNVLFSDNFLQPTKIPQGQNTSGVLPKSIQKSKDILSRLNSKSLKNSTTSDLLNSHVNVRSSQVKSNDEEKFLIGDNHMNLHKEYELEKYDYENTKDCEHFSKDENLLHCVENSIHHRDLYNITPKSKQCNESGYKIIHIKSDSSLQSYKTLQRISTCRTNQNDELANGQCCNNISFPTSRLVSSINKCSNLLSPEENFSPETLLQFSLKGGPYCNKTNTQCSIAESKALPITSTPLSVSSERGLYYATLDLPPCNLEVTANNRFESSNGNPTLIDSNVNNLYAKIDFDHSDSSSASSKNINT